MLERIFDQASDATIAVVGSAPSARFFDPGKCDVSIGVNGAALLGCRFDYFQCSDHEAPQRDWFQVDCARTRIIAAQIASMDSFLYPPEFDDRLPGRLALKRPFQRVMRLPQPRVPHLFYFVSVPNESRLRDLEQRKAKTLLAGATISGQAVQLAYLMGAARIDLYGCSFSQSTSKKPEHYFYQAAPGHIGAVELRQLEAMDRLLSVIRGQGVRIVVHGPTELSEYDEIVENAAGGRSSPA